MLDQLLRFLYIRKSRKLAPKDPLLLYALILNTKTLESRVHKFMTNTCIDYKALTYLNDQNKSKYLYASVIPEPTLEIICNRSGTLNETICREYVFVILDRSLSMMLSYAMSNMDEFCSKYFDQCEEKILEIFKALEYIHNQHGFSFPRDTYQGFIDALYAKKCELRYKALTSNLFAKPSFERLAAAAEECIKADVMSQEMFEELSIAFQRNNLRYHILKNQLT